jgi:hypothetical protein
MMESQATIVGVQGGAWWQTVRHHQVQPIWRANAVYRAAAVLRPRGGGIAHPVGTGPELQGPEGLGGRCCTRWAEAAERQADRRPGASPGLIHMRSLKYAPATHRRAAVLSWTKRG